MIRSDVVCFPQNIVNVLAPRITSIDPDNDLTVFKRFLRPTDPKQSVGIAATLWTPDQSSMEIRGPLLPAEPSLQTYTIGVQAFVTDANEEEGTARHSVLSTLLRAILYRDPSLRVSLSSLSVTLSGATERTRRWGIRDQRMLSNEIDGKFVYLSTLNFWLETETT